MPLHFTWINAASVAAVRELYRLERSEDLKAVYRESLRRAGEAAAGYVSRHREFPDGNERFSGNWRCMHAIWRAQATVPDAVALAVEQLKLWNRESPAIARDKRHVMYPLFAAWIVLLSEDAERIAVTRPEIREAVLSRDWNALYYSGCFVAENVYYELEAQQRSRAK